LKNFSLFSRKVQIKLKGALETKEASRSVIIKVTVEHSFNIDIQEMETASKIVKLEKSVSLLDLFKAKDENVEPRMFYAQQTGMDKVQLYPKMGGESDQIDGLRKDGTDSMENKGIIDSQVNMYIHDDS